MRFVFILTMLFAPAVVLGNVYCFTLLGARIDEALHLHPIVLRGEKLTTPCDDCSSSRFLAAVSHLRRLTRLINSDPLATIKEIEQFDRMINVKVSPGGEIEIFKAELPHLNSANKIYDYVTWQKTKFGYDRGTRTIYLPEGISVVRDNLTRHPLSMKDPRQFLIAQEFAKYYVRAAAQALQFHKDASTFTPLAGGAFYKEFESWADNNREGLHPQFVEIAEQLAAEYRTTPRHEKPEWLRSIGLAPEDGNQVEVRLVEMWEFDTMRNLPQLDRMVWFYQNNIPFSEEEFLDHSAVWPFFMEFLIKDKAPIFVP